MRRILMIAMFVVAACLVGAPRAQAQGCPVGLITCGPGGVAHEALSGFGFGGSIHAECMVCQENGVPIEPGGCHECSASLEISDRNLYKKVLVAASAGNVDAILKLGPGAGRWVKFNAARGSIQVKRLCNPQSIIANLPLRTPQQRIVAARLDDEANSPRRSSAND